jgi:hypothetical protein
MVHPLIDFRSRENSQLYQRQIPYSFHIHFQIEKSLVIESRRKDYALRFVGENYCEVQTLL